MQPAFRRVALIGKRTNEIASSLKALREFLAGRGCEVILEKETAHIVGDAGASAEFAEIGSTADLAIVVGGDGTMLSAARNLARHRTPLAGINQGRLGFMTDIALADMRGSVGAILDVSAAGNSVNAMKSALNGTAKVNLRDGAVKGVDIGAIINKARSALGSQPAQAADGSKERTDFSELNATFVIKNGVAHNEDLDEAKAREVPRWRESAVFTPLERDVLEYAEAMTATQPTVTDELSARLLDALGPAALVELTAWIGLANFMARSNVALGIESQGFSKVCELPLARPTGAVEVPASA